MKKKLLQYSIAVAAGLAVSFGLACLLGLFQSQNAVDVFKKLADACTVTGILVFGAGILTFCANHGAFDMVLWGLKGAVRMLIPGAALREEKKSYAEYREARAAKQKPFKFLLVVGAVFVLLSVIFVLAFFAVDVPAAG